MKILLCAVNATSIGVFRQVKNFIKTLSDIDCTNQYLILLPANCGYEDLRVSSNLCLKFFQNKGLYKIQYVYFYFLKIRYLIKNFSADAIISLGNFLPVNTGIPSIVLVRNLYYIEYERFPAGSFWQKVRKKAELKLFALTIKHTDKFIVQSGYVKNRLSTVWEVPNKQIEVIPNAISLEFNLGGRVYVESPNFLKGKFVLFYPSRFYPYKNHVFVLDVADYLVRKGIKDIIFLVTINTNNAKAIKFMNNVKQCGLSDIIVNIGEVPQNELSKWYPISDALFFPSQLETFGNSFIEAMCFGLPICATDLPYAKAVCGDAAIYYTNNSIEDAASKIILLKDNNKIREKLAHESRRAFSNWPTNIEIVKRYLSVVGEITGADKKYANS